MRSDGSDSGGVNDRGSHGPIDLKGLSPRELEAITHALSGLSSSETALEMGIKPSTVRNLLSRSYSKLGVRGLDDVARGCRSDHLDHDGGIEEGESSESEPPVHDAVRAWSGDLRVLIGVVCLIPLSSALGVPHGWDRALAVLIGSSFGCLIGCALLARGKVVGEAGSQGMTARRLHRDRFLCMSCALLIVIERLLGSLLGAWAHALSLLPFQIVEFLAALLIMAAAPSFILPDSPSMPSFYEAAGSRESKPRPSFPWRLGYAISACAVGGFLGLTWAGGAFSVGYPSQAAVEFLIPAACAIGGILLLAASLIDGHRWLLALDVTLAFVVISVHSWSAEAVPWFLAASIMVFLARAPQALSVRLIRAIMLSFALGAVASIPGFLGSLSAQAAYSSAQDAFGLALFSSIRGYLIGLVACLAVVAAFHLSFSVRLDLVVSRVAGRLDRDDRDRLRKYLGFRGLNDTQIDVSLLVLDGLTRREVAERLCIAIGTVNSAKREAYRKLGISSRSELASLLERASGM